MLSVIIPARNEAHNIERCVRSILAARYEPLEVIVVDDHSTDGTAAIVGRIMTEEGRRLHLMRSPELPAGWFGKQWALVRGLAAARGELLVFADADTSQHPELIPRTVAALSEERVDFVTVVARQEMVTFWERLVQPHVFFVLGSRVGDLRRVNRTRIVWDAIANGQYILVDRAAYEAVGTHAAVKDTVADDVALAQAFVRHGKDIFLAHAAEFMSTRMYRSLAEIVDGWSKNLALGAPLMMPPIPFVRRTIPYLMWVPALLWIVPPILLAVTGATAALLATIASLATWIEINRRERVPVWYAALYPVGAMIVAYIMARSAIRGRRVEWKGRAYNTDA
jgi:chlorobactene glucosyltransferase